MVKSARLLAAASVGALVLGVASQAYAQPSLKVDPRNFVGKPAQCGGTGGSKIVTSAWLNGMGLPDNGNNHPAGSNVHQGLLLSKNGPTENCSAAVADIVGDIPLTLTNLGFDFRNGAHCGAGAPRINVVSVVGQVTTTYFFGCQAADKAPAPQDGVAWTRASFDDTGGPYAGAEGFVFGPPGVGTPVNSITIVFDEGTTLGGAPYSVGLAVLDNIRINNTFIRNKAVTPIVP